MPIDCTSLILYISTTALSAFAGASAAFYWERYTKRNEEKKKATSAGNRAIFLMSQQYNVLNGLKKQLIDHVRNDPNVWINMPASLPRAHDDLRFDIASLQFLLISDNPNLLGELLVEEQRFFEALKTINERSLYHRNELQPKLDALKIQQGQYVIPSQLEASLGAVMVGTLKTLTSALIEHTDEGMEGVKNIHSKLVDQLRNMFPGERIIEMKYDLE